MKSVGGNHCLACSIFIPKSGNGFGRQYCSSECVIENRVHRGPTEQCWPWTGPKRKGYGVIYKIDRSTDAAHRVAWQVANGREIPEGLVICHRCDNRICCNPGHLFLGTQAENVADMFAKGRQKYPTGLANHRGKLSDEDVRAIRAEALLVPTGTLAEKFGVSYSLVCNILAGRVRSHVR